MAQSKDNNDGESQPQRQVKSQYKHKSSQVAQNLSHELDTNIDDPPVEDELDDGKGDTIVRDVQEISKKEDRFLSCKAFLGFKREQKERSITYEKEINTKDLAKYTPDFLEQFTKRRGWMPEPLVDVQERLVHEFYANTAHQTKVTNVKNLKVKFDKKTLNDYLGPENMEPTDTWLSLLAVRPWVAEILAPGTSPSQVAAGVKIYLCTLNSEAKGWQTFVCTGLTRA